ncbi:hypothetical protein NFI96_020084 [Prochilodus magdalenae]|nr:hypothetical protein NFI96_020084 [Prochilodus magdalenae]
MESPQRNFSHEGKRGESKKPPDSAHHHGGVRLQSSPTESTEDTVKKKSRSMGVSKQLSNDLKTKTVHRHGLGEGYKKLSQRFQLSVSTVRNSVSKWKTTGTV